MTNPLGASTAPVLSWRVQSPTRGERQTAWQLLVASSAEVLAAHRGDLWDSGRTVAQREPGVAYRGSPLKPGTRCHWKVRSWGLDGQPSGWSEPAVMEIAPMAPADWQGARWIDDGRDNPNNDEEFYQPDPAPLFRHEFVLEKRVSRARLHVAGVGYCLPSLNGNRLADVSLDPPWTAFDRRILFRTHDVTSALQPGANCLGLAVGNGWFNPLPLRMWGHRNIRGSLATGRPRAIALLVIDHPDGTRSLLATGPAWRVAPGPTLRNSIFLGEERDGRLALPGWDQAGFDAAGWKPVRIPDAPLDPLQPLLDMPPVRATAPIPARAVTSPSPGVFIVDFGTNFTGVPVLRLAAPAGTRVVLRYGEILHADGTLNPMTSVCGQIKGTRNDAQGRKVRIGGPGAPEIAWQQDVYITRGGGETYRPDFTFHAFRYMEITGLPAAPKPEEITGVPLHSDLPDAGSFSCSNALLNRIQDITRRTFLNNVVSVQSDCPHRERFGYGGDIAVTSEAFLMNFGMAGFYAKTVRDWADAARPDGNFTDTAPFVGIQYCGVGWAMVHPLLLEQLYQHYGDRRIVEQQLPVAVRWFELEAAKREKNLVTKGLGDHEALGKAAGPAVTTPMFVDTARRLARLSRLVGREEQAARFGRMADESAAAWAKAFLDANTGKVGGGSQSEQVLALAFGAAPEGARPAVFDHLVASLAASPGGPSLTTGIFGTRFLLEELTARGRHDLAYALASRSAFPSWGWMLENGATTLWETWKQSDNTYSHNHPMFGSVSAWFFRHLGGIQAASDAIGFDRVIIRPRLAPGLEWVKSSHRSPRGMIVSDWNAGPAGAEFRIAIPPDTQAIVELPVAAGDRLFEGGGPVASARGVLPLPGGAETQRLQVGSGSYHFRVQRGP